jgi:hypothetical protein
VIASWENCYLNIEGASFHANGLISAIRMCKIFG